jgi:hypothetical protein
MRDGVLDLHGSTIDLLERIVNKADADTSAGLTLSFLVSFSSLYI